MAQVLPAKRPRASIDHRPSINGVAGPSRSKRPRHSTIEPSERDERDYSEDVESRHPQDEEASSNEPDDAEDDEAVYVRATQMVQKSLRKTAELKNTPAEAGIVEEIRCTNFMCHEQLTVTLGPLINFIIGHNGSGKSAVLTALTLCLGGKATATNRGQNLKSFIKEGRDYSILSVKIKNQGSTAYKPDQYGDSIIVERHFNRSGASGFKLKDRNGRIVSTKKADLEDIIDAFAMQIDNPMNVLTQDMARQFLNDSNPKEKYKFFLRGTQLETLNRDYLQISQELEEQESRAQTLQGDLDVYRKKLEHAVEKAKRASNLETMRAKEMKLAHQAAWAQVEGEERELADIDAELGRISNVIAQRKAEADAHSEQFERADQALEDAQAEVQELQAQIEPAEQVVADRKAQWHATKKSVLDLKMTERNIITGIKTSEQSIKNTQSQIQDHRQRQAEADNGLYAQRLSELEDAKATCEQDKAAWENSDNDLPAKSEHLKSAREQKLRADERRQQKREEEQRSRAKLRDLEQGHRKWVESYPNPAGLEKLLHAIENERRFRERPVGPMGRYVELKKPEWGYILEKSFGAALSAFVVTSKADQSTLSELMRRYNYQVPIYIGKKDRINTSDHEPDERLVTWMRVLEIKNDLVRNQLIINQNIDQIVLIQKRSEAHDFMLRHGPERRNVKACFAMSDGSRRLGHLIHMNQQSGAVRLEPINEYQGSFRMQADKGRQIQEEKDNLARIQRETRDVEAAVRAAQDQLNACQAAMQDHKNTKLDLKVKFQRAQDVVEALESALSAATPDADVIEILEKELADAQHQLELDQEQYKDMVVELDNQNDEARLHKTRLDDAEKALEELRFQLEKHSAKVQTLTQRREQALRRKNAALEDVQAAETNKADWEQRRAEQEAQVDTSGRDAESICARIEVPPNETFESLKRRLDRMAKERERSEKELGGSEEELLRQANDAKKTYYDAKKEMEGTQHVRTVLKVALQTRQERWRRFRQEISVRARVTFNYLLSERQFRGSLSVDHTNSRLDIHVQPDITVNSAAGRQTKTLSGGEKSFSTICLLLSLWDAMGSPIRCLDEFDVFMDSVNRDISMTMMIGAARRAVGRQYILITPQAMNNKSIHSMDDVRIIRMDDPERGQTALNFGR